MRTVLVYSDSLAWGIVPGTRQRLPFEQRWPGVLQGALREAGHDVRVLEDCLNGRRTAFDDPYKPGRNGLAGLPQVIEAQSPLDLVILMVGTNDVQSVHPHTAWHAAQGVAACIRAVRTAPIEPGMPVPAILVVCPPLPDDPRSTMAEKFAGASQKAAGMPEQMAAVCVELDCAFVDAGTITGPSAVDGVHLDADQHDTLGRALAPRVARLLGDGA